MTAAVFDLDNTLVRGASLFHVARDLARQGVLTRRILARAAAQQAVYRLTAREHGVDTARERGLALVAGISVDDLEGWCTEALDRTLHAVLYPGSLRLLRAHQEAGHRTFLATAAPVQIASVVSAMLGCDGAVGTRAAHTDGVFTGHLDGPVLRGQAKADAVAILATQENVNLSQASAYSDSHNDIPLLRLVGDPHAVNPDGRLRRLARREDWPVHDVSRRRQVMLWTGTGALAAGAGAVAAGVTAVARRAQP